MGGVGEGFGAVEGGERNIDGCDGPAARHQSYRVLPCPAGEVERATGGEEWKGLEEEGIGLRRGMEGRVGIAGIRSLGSRRHTGKFYGGSRRKTKDLTRRTRRAQKRAKK